MLTIPLSALRSLLAAMYYVTLAPRLSRDATFDALFLNGPGTCVVLCVATYVNRVEFDYFSPHPHLDIHSYQ
jgi:beta-1,4-N-acetylglucosaminyltransferase